MQQPPNPRPRLAPVSVQQIDTFAETTATIIPLSAWRPRATPHAASLTPDLPAIEKRIPDTRRARRQREESVSGVSGLNIVTYQTGRRVYVYRYYDPLTGRRQSIVLGDVSTMTLMEVIDLVRRCVEDLKNGRSPRREILTVDQYFQREYLPWARSAKKSWKDDASRYRNHIRPLLGDLPLDKVTHRDVQRLIDHLRSGPVGADGERLSNASINRIVSLLCAILREAVRAGHLAASPLSGLRQLPEAPRSPRSLELDQLAAMGPHLDAAPLLVRLLVRFLLLTALRISEALNARFADVDSKRCILRLPVTKSGEAQTVPLSPAALEVIAELRAHRRNDYLFPAHRGDGPMSPPRKALKKLMAAAGIEASGFHCFRKTAVTEAMACPGVDLLTVSRWLRHKSIRTSERHYLATSEKRLQHAVAQVGAVMQKHLQRSAAARRPLAPSTRSIVITPAVRFLTA